MFWKKITILLIVLVIANSWPNKRMLQTDGFNDPFCAVYDQQTGDCLGCICRGYFDNDRRCHAVNDLCATWNINTGECTSCYRGYELINSTCITIAYYNPGNESQTSIENLNCLTDNGNGTCLSCRPYYVLYCNDCQTTGENPFCAKFQQSNVCVECDIGYELDVNNVCQQFEFDDNSTDNDTDNSTTCLNFENCQECNATECTLCEEGYRQQYQSRECVLPTTNCSQGCASCSPNECFSCEAGYSAQSWPICINCSYMFGRNSKGECKAIQRDCSAYQNCAACVEGECTNCQEGYALNANLECALIV